MCCTSLEFLPSRISDPGVAKVLLCAIYPIEEKQVVNFFDIVYHTMTVRRQRRSALPLPFLKLSYTASDANLIRFDCPVKHTCVSRSYTPIETNGCLFKTFVSPNAVFDISSESERKSCIDGDDSTQKTVR